VAIARLVEAGILHEANNRAWGRIFEAREIIDAFTDLERQLASPAGDTRVEPPVRKAATHANRATNKARGIARPKDAFKEVGSGSIDIPAVLKAADAAGVKHYFVEQDQTPGDPIASLRQSYKYLSSLFQRS